MALPYRTAGLARHAAAIALVRALQHDLRALGYLTQGIDGQFGDGTEQAVRRLQYDLINNAGISTQGDGAAPVAIRSYNRGRVDDRTGVVDAGLADCIDDLLTDTRVTKLPTAADAPAANSAALQAIAAATGRAPIPFLLAMFTQESNARHYHVPTAQDTDNFVSVGLDAHPDDPDHVTSRGYGIGQYTIFHHPPRAEEVTDFIVDPVGNVKKAIVELRTKFDGFVLGDVPGTRADDRIAEHPAPLTLRECRYPPGDARYLKDCRNCAVAAAKIDIGPNTPVLAGTPHTYGEAPHYKIIDYRGVPNRADFPCDWPYAARRYNGSGPDSYNYQARILRNLLTPAVPPAGGGDPSVG